MLCFEVQFVLILCRIRIFLLGGDVCRCWHSRSSWHPHAAHSVTEAMRPEGGHIILLDLHLVALEVRELIQADLVLKAVLHGRI